jgi:N-alpha-acetyl-L-2,4-diaminobutyrate deacetylase
MPQSIHDFLISGGGKNRTQIETPRAHQGLKAVLPVLTITGRTDGPTAVITACQHGRELNGIASIERAFSKVAPEDVTGSVVFLPILNPLGIRLRQQDFPYEDDRYRSIITHSYNMNRTWGRSPEPENYAQAVTNMVWETFSQHADVLLDLHGWTDASLGLAWALKEHQELLQNFGFPYYMMVSKSKKDGFCSESAAEWANIPMVVCELVPQNTLNLESVAYGERGICNLLRHSGILAGELELPEEQIEFNDDHREEAIKTPVEGLVVANVRKGDMVKEGDQILRILSLDSLETAWEYTAPCDGLIFNVGAAPRGEDIRESSVVYPGQMVGILKRPDRIIEN